MAETQCRYSIGHKGKDGPESHEHYRIPALFEDNAVKLLYSVQDQFVAGGVYPVTEILKLEALGCADSGYFLENRELGIINLGGEGRVTVDGVAYELFHREALYVGRGAKEVVFERINAQQPCFFLAASPADRAFPSKKNGIGSSDAVHGGSSDKTDKTIHYSLIPERTAETCRLRMELTEFRHGRQGSRTTAEQRPCEEVYFYFDCEKAQTLSHFMGKLNGSGHVFVQQQAGFSSEFKVHIGEGFSNSAFIWSDAGES
ncbi:5-deoxy-glucuronate isomerase [uncultured Flavobacterium sp.]|uniref:5-deoxy-glucuronate isomerase n=1 Tax=uncultured Flavobacterium sp. TaxID=165435 RepID=UPI0025958566|nr:5-deoxy-glucuronate isomerase [uncultured Flavobacterium sp.]